MYNCGMIACEVPAAALEELFKEFVNEKTTLTVDTDNGNLNFKAGGKEKTISFTLKDFEKALVEAGGWVEYAAKHY
jgi:3-isopropylmalate/(R)-2-methylmalate dehydratase small subunit